MFDQILVVVVLLLHCLFFVNTINNIKQETGRVSIFGVIILILTIISVIIQFKNISYYAQGL